MHSDKNIASPDEQVAKLILDSSNLAFLQDFFSLFPEVYAEDLLKLLKNRSTQSIEMRLDDDLTASRRHTTDSPLSEVPIDKPDSTDHADDYLITAQKNHFVNRAPLPSRNTRNPYQLNNISNNTSLSLFSDTHVFSDENTLNTANNPFLTDLYDSLSPSLPDTNLSSTTASVSSLPSPILAVDSYDHNQWNHATESLPEIQDVLNSFLNSQYQIDNEESLEAEVRYQNVLNSFLSSQYKIDSEESLEAKVGYQADRFASPSIDTEMNAEPIEMFSCIESGGEFTALSNTDDLSSGGKLERFLMNTEYDDQPLVLDWDRLSTFNNLSDKISAFRKEDEQGQSRKRTYVKMKECDLDDILKEDFKKERRRQQNRQAANKWRKKKKDTIDTLQKELKDTKTELENSQKENKILKQIIANYSKKSCKYNYNGTINNF